MENKNRAWTKWIFWFSLAITVALVYKILDNFGGIMDGIKGFLGVLSPFLVGILISYILYVPCTKVEETYSKVKKVKFISKKARLLSVLTVYFIVLILFIILINVILPPVIQSVIDLTNNFGHYYTVAIEKINELPENSILKTQTVQKVLTDIKNINLEKVIDTENLTGYVQGIAGMLGGIFNVFVSIIVSIYILNRRRGILDFLRRLTGAIFEKKTYENIDKYFNRTNQIFFKFLASQILDGIIVGIITSIAMTIMGIKYSVLLGFMIGLFNIIPYFGAIIAVTLAGIITFFTGGLSQAIWMLVVVIILQQIDANIINPKIVGDSLKISPLLVIFAVTLGGAYFGVIGMFLAVPVAAVLMLVVEDYIEVRNKKKGEDIIMNKGKFVKKLKEVTKREENECVVINSILEDHFIIGKNNKEKIKADFIEKLNMNEEEADELYNICMETVVKGIFNK